MSFNISYIFQAIDKFSSPVGAINRSVDALKNKTGQLAQAFDKAQGKLDKLSARLAATGDKIKNVGKALSLRITAPFVAFAALAVKQSADIETLTLSFEALLKSAGKAQGLMKNLQSFKERAPLFGMEDIATSAKRLLGAGFKEHEILPALNITSNIAAGSGNSLENINIALGKVRAKGKASAQDLMQLQEMGVPILRTLARGFRLTETQVLRMAQKGRVGFEGLYAALLKMTSENEIFNKQVEKQSKTINGLVMTLRSKLSTSLVLIGNQFIKAFGGTQGLERLIKFFDKLNTKMTEFFEKHPTRAKYIILIVTALALLPPVLLAAGVAIKLLGISMKALFLNPVGLAIGAIALLVTALVHVYNKSEKIRNAINRLASAFANDFKILIDIFAKLIDKIGSLNLGQALIHDIKMVMGYIEGLINGIKWLINGLNEVSRRSRDFVKEKATQVSAMPNFSEKISNSSLALKPISNNSKAEVFININDKNNNVKSLQTTKKGPLELRVGRNMSGAQ